MVFKYIEIIGVSDKDFQDAANNALKEASKTIHDIRWVEIVRFGGTVEGSKIKEYQAVTKIAFEIKK